VSTTPSAENPPPAQEQRYPGRTGEMDPKPHDEMHDYQGSGLLAGQRALVTGATRASAAPWPRHSPRRARTSPSPICRKRKTRTRRIPPSWSGRRGSAAPRSGRIDRTFRVNIFSYFLTTRAALAHLPDGGAIINTSSINGLRGNKSLIDYAATKGAVLAFTYSLAQSLQDRGIRVNCVAPGPVWTPLIPSTFGARAAARPRSAATGCPSGRPGLIPLTAGLDAAGSSARPGLSAAGTPASP
jgi:short subunit dehydrogenase